jgi:signal peptidase I
MKTEKRKAKVGERILITNKYLGEDRYENGDVLTVLGLEGNGGDVYVFSKDSGLVNYEEYEVLIDENETEADNVGIIEKLQAELEALKERVAALESRPRTNMPEEVREDLKRRFREKQQKRRDEIIEKAKREVEEIRNDPIQMEGLLAAFVVDREKRRVTALLSSVLTGVVERQGVAKCHPDDCFNLHLGKVIALYKALGLEVPDEYLNAPQPTEVRVGDILEYKGKRYTVSKAPLKNSQCGVNSIAVHNGKIIDDSREGVSE